MSPDRPDGATALVNAMIVPGTGQPPFPGSVVVEGDRIVDVIEGGGRPVPTPSCSAWTPRSVRWRPASGPT